MNENSQLRVVIVDDEFHARKLLMEYVSKVPFLHLAGNFENPLDALSLLQRENIDLLLLDIQMPGITGLEFARSLKNPPQIIFTTAYSEYAVDGFELEAVDYLLKPIAFPRFLQAVTKAHERIGTSIYPIQPERVEEQEMSVAQSYIVVKEGAKIHKINFSDLIYIEGQREYVTFHTTRQRITVLYTMKILEEQLPPELFIRIHKSYIVSFDRVEAIEGKVLTIAGEKLQIGGSYKEELMKRLMQG